MVTIVVIVAFGNINDVHALAALFGPETWIFLATSLLTAIGAVACATACLWSRHG